MRSIAYASGASNGTAFATANAVIQDAGTRVSFGFRFTGTLSPTNNGGDFMNFLTSGFTSVYCLAITSGGLLRVLGSTGNTLGTGATALTASTDYRISAVYTVTSTTVNSFKLYINGNLELTLTNVTLGTTGTTHFGIGVGQFNTIGSNVSLFFAHFYIDNQTANDPGNIRVTAKRPFSNGTANNFTTQIGAGGSGYGTGHAPQVNERPLSVTNGWAVTSAGSAITEEYNIEGVSVGDNDLTGATVVDYTGWLYTKALIAETGKIVVNNVQTNISITTSNALFTKIAGSATYPAGTGTDIGEVTATTVTTVSLYEAGVLVAYIPAVATTAAPTHMMLGMGC